MKHELYKRKVWLAIGGYLERGRCDKALIDICKRYDVQAEDVRDMLADCLE